MAVFSKIENKILNFWEKNKIFEKSLKKRKGRKNFVFYEGPPYANGRPGIHHLLVRAFKDVVLRYKTMRGFFVKRKAGWDTHGLPTEIEAEKKLKVRSKKEIEILGIEKFIKECKKNVFLYKKEWEKFTKRIGYWLDLENPYITCSNEYIESLWWILKKIWEKGLLKKDYKVIAWCPRCETSLSSHEVAQGYKKIKERAIYVKFKIISKERRFKNSFFLVWTTTPWTLPGNVALAVNKEFVYCKVKFKEKEGNYILLKERLKFISKEYEILEEFKGKDLIGIKYEPLYPQKLSEKEKIYLVVGGDFVSKEEGTGIVHIAPAFGEEDFELGKKEKLPVLLTVDQRGCLKKDLKVGGGMFVKEADRLIVEDLKKRELLFKEEIYEHDYPFCWRCHSPLLYYAKESWFIKVTKIKEKLIKNNKKINWIPSYLKEGRFGEWLRTVRDWTLSRERFWGAPLPVWECKKCNKTEVIGSKKELISQKFTNNVYYLMRHGESFRQKKKVTCCWPEPYYCPLTKKGKEEILKTAKELKKEKIDIIFASDLLRTKQTAEILKKELGVEVIFDKRLREYNVGVFNGKDPKKVWEYLENSKDLFSKKIPKGESLIDLKKRMYKFLEDIDRKFSKKKILIISHELPLSLLESALKGMSKEEFLKWRWDHRLEVGEWRKVEFKKLPFNEKMELDFHRPYIDKVEFFCKNCGEKMRRVSEVIDCWFDSGSMPFAQYHYPFENKNLIDKRIQFPADFICEGVDQTRGWFYTLLVISTLLGFGPPYKNVVSLGHVLDEKGEKMSKSKGNVVDPWEMIEKYGVDSVRWYFYTLNQPGEPKLFNERDLEKTMRRFTMIYWNCFSFFKMYWTGSNISQISFKPQNILDKWIISRLEETVFDITQKLEKYNIVEAARKLEDFVVNDLSLWYIKASRERFQRPKTKKELQTAQKVLGEVLLKLAKISAPFVPFISEKIYQELKKDNRSSVHLEDWPKGKKSLMNKTLMKEMDTARNIVRLVLKERAKFSIKVRQPLPLLKIKIPLRKEILEIIKKEVNVKQIIVQRDLKSQIELDTTITPELKEEGILREIKRIIQHLKKQASYKRKDKIEVFAFGGEFLNKILNQKKQTILKDLALKRFEIKRENKKKFDIEREIKLEGEVLWVGMKKV